MVGGLTRQKRNLFLFCICGVCGKRNPAVVSLLPVSFLSVSLSVFLSFSLFSLFVSFSLFCLSFCFCGVCGTSAHALSERECVCDGMEFYLKNPTDGMAMAWNFICLFRRETEHLF